MRVVEKILATSDVEPLPRKNGPDRTLGGYEEVLIMQCIFEKPSVCRLFKYTLLSYTMSYSMNYLVQLVLATIMRYYYAEH